MHANHPPLAYSKLTSAEARAARLTLFAIRIRAPQPSVKAKQ